MNYILQEYNDTIKTSSWMDESTKENALKTTGKMSRYIGYHAKLRSEEVQNFYNDLPSLSEDNFLEMGLAFTLFSTDREFKRLHQKKKVIDDVNDWTK